MSLPEIHVSRANQTTVPLTGLMFEGEPTDDIEVGLGPHPVTTWTPYPGPQTPYTRGRWLVVVRHIPSGAAVDVGYLVVS